MSIQISPRHFFVVCLVGFFPVFLPYFVVFYLVSRLVASATATAIIIFEKEQTEWRESRAESIRNEHSVVSRTFYRRFYVFPLEMRQIVALTYCWCFSWPILLFSSFDIFMTLDVQFLIGKTSFANDILNYPDIMLLHIRQLLHTFYRIGCCDFEVTPFVCA